MKAAIYTRVSTEEQAQEGVSLAMQEERCRRFAFERDLLDLDHYVDDGVSGTRFDRPALQEMLGRLADYDTIIIWKLDRLSRSVYDWAYMMETFSRAHVGLVSVTENFDCSSAVGRAMMGMMAVFAQLFVDILAENVSAAIRHNVEQGKHHGAVPFGYDRDDGRLIIIPDEAEVVYTIFKEYLLQSRSVSELAMLANRRQWGGAASIWRGNRVWRMLRNPVYAGRVRIGDDEFPGLHEPIVPPEMWQRAQARLLRRAQRRGGTPSTWSGLYRCGICGSSVRSDGTDAHGRYRCRARFELAPDLRHEPVSVSCVPADAIVRAWTLRLVDGAVWEAAVREVAADEADDPERERRGQQEELAEVKAAIRDYHLRVSSGTLPAAMLPEMTAPLIRRYEELTATLREGAERQREIPRWLQRVGEGGVEALLDGLPATEQVELLRDIYECVEIEGGRLTFHHRIPLPPLTVTVPRWVRREHLRAAAERAIDEAVSGPTFR